MSRPEILAPAGNREMLGAAVFSGADAVYLGLTGFNARRTAGNFTPDELREAVVFCHARGVKVHVTLNTLVYDRELSGLADAVRAVAAAGADAVISDDLATAQLVKSIAPTLHLHGSTQMSVHTPEGAKELAALGYDRVILARELSLEEIRAVCEASPIEVEVFVHGALCMSVSGQCMMSAFLGGRSGNRGACAGPCRLPFDASAGLKPGQPGRACHLSLKDMDYIPHLRELMDAGVASVKIEGRLRTPEYAAAVVTACRAVCAGQPYDEKLVRDIFSRSGFTDGYLTNRNDGKMFGVRTEADAAATRVATPKARELFRRELQRVPVHYELSGGVEDVQIWDCDLANSLSGIEIKATPKRGGYVRGVTVRDCITPRVMLHSVPYNDDGVPAGAPPKLEHCFFERLTLTAEVLDHDRSRHDAAPIEIAGFDKPGYEVEDIVFKDITITKPSVALPLGLCKGVTLSNLACVKE